MSQTYKLIGTPSNTQYTVFIHLYIHTYIHTHIHTYTQHTYIDAYVHTSIHCISYHHHHWRGEQVFLSPLGERVRWEAVAIVAASTTPRTRSPTSRRSGQRRDLQTDGHTTQGTCIKIFHGRVGWNTTKLGSDTLRWREDYVGCIIKVA